MMKPRLVFLQTTLVSSLAAIYGPAAVAQTAPAAAPAPGTAASAPRPATAASGAAPRAELNSVTVTGYRASLQRAMDRKRNADSIVDVISAEDIGKFPDTNAAESLSHLPGIAVDRQFGEGEKVSINGTDPALNRVLINGQTIASGDWGGNPTDTSGRTFNYTLLSPEIIGVMEVYKSPEARIDEGSIGGTVIIHTRKPLDLPANTLRASLGYGYNDRSREGNPRGSALYSWKNESNSFGVLAAVSHDRQDISRAGIEFFGYGTGRGIPATTPVTGSGDPQTARIPVGINSAYFQQTRQRDGFQGAAQWKLDERNELNLTAIYVKGKYDNFSESRYVVPVADLEKFSKVGVNNGLITSGTIVKGTPAADYRDQPYAQLDTNLRESKVDTKSLNLRHDFKADSWKLASQLGYTSASGGKSPEYLQSFIMQRGGYSFTYGPKSAGVTYDDGSASNWVRAATDPSLPAGSNAGTQAGGIYYQKSHDNERYAQLDWSKSLDWGPVNEVLVGAKYIKHDNGVDARGNRINTTSAITLSQFGNSTAPSNLYKGLDVSGDLNNWPTADRGAVVAYLTGQPQGPFNIDYGSTFDVKERTDNLYTQFNYDWQGLRGNFGVRYLDTTDTANYFLSNNGAPYVPASTETSYKKFLPSFNAAYDIDSSKVVRFSVAKVMARPRYFDIAGATSRDTNTTTGVSTGSGGNPNIKPYESVNYDVAGEWYFAPQSMVGAEIFFRDISNYVVTVTNDQVINGRTYTINSPANASSAKVKGVSLLYQQPLWYGFGIQANYTWAQADTAAGLNLPYLSKNTVNVIPYYEQGPVSARLVYSWRSQYFTGLGRLNSQDFTDQYKQLDLSASYQLTKNLSINVGATNLLDETYYQYSGSKDAPTAFYKNGRTLTVGMNFKL